MGVLVLCGAIIPREYVHREQKGVIDESEWDSAISNIVNQSIIVANIDSKQLRSTVNGIFMSEGMTLMVPTNYVRDTFDCSAREYNDKYVLIEKGNDVLKLFYHINKCEFNGELKEIKNGLEIKNQITFVPVDILCQLFGYSYNFDTKLNQVNIVSTNPNARSLPYSFCYEDNDRIMPVGNQGNLGTCWAFASLAALSSSLMPMEKYSFSVDHMTMSNSYGLKQSDGGDYTMSLAYLLAWQGPVLEKDDPYGDGVSTSGLIAEKHLQEVQLIESKDYEAIKKMIFKYGGVQSSFYASIINGNTSESRYYNKKTNAYCYIGDSKPNHDIVIIGWDDNYPKENFNIEVEGNGAFICRNSWGDDFGENGNFYISYFDTNIGVRNVVYTKVESNTNYDKIYQTDLCGFVGLLGYESDTAYFANAYTATEDEYLRAVGFYSTGIDTEYSVYVCENFNDASSLSKRSDPVVTGTLKNSGYYTINLDKTIKLSEGQKYAVIVRIKTPNVERPVAVEYPHSWQTANVDISDGEGYVSMKGRDWENTETVNGCNVCLKVYTSYN